MCTSAGPQVVQPLLCHTFRNGRIVVVRDGELLFFALGTGEYSELARE